MIGICCGIGAEITDRHVCLLPDMNRKGMDTGQVSLVYKNFEEYYAALGALFVYRRPRVGRVDVYCGKETVCSVKRALSWT